MAVDGSLHDSAGPIKPPSIATLAAAARRGGVDGTALRPTGRVVAVSEVSPRRESIVGYVGFAEDEDAKRLKGGETKVKGKGKEKEKEKDNKYPDNIPALRLYPTDPKLPWMIVDMSPTYLPDAIAAVARENDCLLYTSPSPRDRG